MKTALILTLTFTALFLIVTPALADEPQAAPQTESPAVPAIRPLPENVQALLNTNTTILDMMLDLSFTPALTSAKLYFRTNDESGTAFWIQVIVNTAGGAVTLPNDFDENVILGVKQVKAGGIVEEWVNEQLLERLAEKFRKEQPKKEKVKFQL